MKKVTKAKRVFDKTAHSTLWYAIADYIRINGIETEFCRPLAHEIKKAILTRIRLNNDETRLWANCYACEACKIFCSRCPLTKGVCGNNGGLYESFCRAIQYANTEKAYKLACEIADGKVRKGWMRVNYVR